MSLKNANIGNSAVTLTVSKMMTLLLSIVTSMLLSRYLSLEQYGTYSELLTVTSLAMSMLSLGLPNCLNYFIPQCGNKKEKSEFISFYCFAVTVISLIVALVLFFGKGIIVKYYGNPELALYGFFLTVIPWTKLAISSRGNMLVVSNRVRTELIYSVANSICLLAVTVLLMLKKGSFTFYLYLYVAVELFFTLLVYYEAFICADKKIRLNFKPGMIKTVLAFSISLGISTAISTVSVDLDKLIIGWCMGESDVAVYANAGKELPFSYISTSFTAVALPQIVKRIKDSDIKGGLKLWKSSCEICLIVLGFCAAASIVFAPQIITLLYSEKYLAGVGIFRIYSLVLLFRITYWGMLLNALGRTREILYNSAACLGLNLILSIIFYNIIGFAGPALASCISIGFMAFVQLLRTSKLVNIPVKAMFPWKSFAKELLCCAAGGVLFWGISRFINIGTDIKGIIYAIILGAVWAAVYFLIMIKRIKRIWRTFGESSEHKKL